MLNSAFDPYWEFDKANHFRPLVSRTDFFRFTGYVFINVVYPRFPEMVLDEASDLVIAMELSYGQKALYYLSQVDSQIGNGGFVQLYYNSFGQYLPTTIKALRYIGEEHMAALLENAEGIYLKNRALMEEARQHDLFGSDIYERMEAFSPLEDVYYKMIIDTQRNVERYIRNHPDEFCLDEQGH